MLEIFATVVIGLIFLGYLSTVWIYSEKDDRFESIVSLVSHFAVSAGLTYALIYVWTR